MDDRQLLLLIFVIIIIILVVFVFFRQNDQNESSECQSDKDCIDGICYNGQCLECAFDSDCCGTEICQNGFCIEGPPFVEPPIPPFATDDVFLPAFAGPQALWIIIANQNYGLTEETFTPTGDIFIIPGTYDLDWSTFTILQMRSYTVPNGGPFFIDPNNTFPYGTNVSPDLVGPGNYVAPNRMEWTGQNAEAGRVFWFEVFNNGDGTISWEAAANPSLPAVSTFDVSVEILFQITDVEGLTSNIGTFYFQMPFLLSP